MLILGLLLSLFHFSTTPTRWWSNYLPISMWLFTLIAFAIITATTASAITVVIIIFSFLCFFWSRRVSDSCFTYYPVTISLTWNLPSRLLRTCCFIFSSAKVMPFFWISATMAWQNDEKLPFFDSRQEVAVGGLIQVNYCQSPYFTYFRISLLFLLFLAGSGMNPSVSPVLSVIAWNTAAA